jgi:ferric-dicitrate binding protein FerR (iron transport regulator)
MMDQIDWERLARYVSGQSSAEERAAVERWAAEDAGHRRLVASLEARWSAAGSAEAWDVDAAWQRLSGRLTAGAAVVVPIEPRRFRWTRPAVLLPLAAAVAFAAAIAVWRAGTPAESSLGGTLAASDPMTTGVGERRTIDLGDGTRVVLGAASRLRLGEGYGGTQRPVFLEGQARFHVIHDPARPFIVHARGTLAEDLGTEFDVRAYAGDNEVRVVVAEGLVALRREGRADTSAVLRPRDVAMVDPAGGTTVLRDQNIDRFLAWASGEIVFEDASLSEVAQELERWYDIECRITDPSIGNRRYSGPFRADSLDAGLEALDTALPDVRIERRGRIVTFTAGTSAMPSQRPARVDAGA